MPKAVIKFVFEVYGMDCWRTYLHMPQSVITFVFKVLRNGLCFRRFRVFAVFAFSRFRVFTDFVCTVTGAFIFLHMGVSKNWGTPKWMVYNGTIPIKMDDLGGKPTNKKETPIFSQRDIVAISWKFRGMDSWGWNLKLIRLALRSNPSDMQSICNHTDGKEAFYMG